MPTRPQPAGVDPAGVRGVTLATLAAACVFLGPVPPVVAALERIYAVAVVDERRLRARGRRQRGPVSPPGRRPLPDRP